MVISPYNSISLPQILVSTLGCLTFFYIEFFCRISVPSFLFKSVKVFVSQDDPATMGEIRLTFSTSSNIEIVS